MNTPKVTVKKILEWIDEKNRGDDRNYTSCKEDTTTAITVFKSLYGRQFKSTYHLFKYLINTLEMRTSDTNSSAYRAFIVLQNDEILNLRLSQHFSTRDSAKNSWNKGKPTIEYHMVVERTQPLNPKKDIYADRMFKNVVIKVREFDISEFNDGHFRKDTIDEIIKLLTYGTSPSSSVNESVRLTESQLQKVISNCVRQILNEEYKVVERNTKFNWGNGDEGFALITLKTDLGGESRVVENDGCYVLYQKVGDDYKPAPFLYPEAFNAMKKLPNLPLR